MNPFDSEVLSIERAGHVATVFLDRPEARNAMGAALFEDLPAPWSCSTATRRCAPSCSRRVARTSASGSTSSPWAAS